MRGDKISRNRSLLLARWRGTAGVAGERDQGSAATASLPAEAVPAGAAVEGGTAIVSAAPVSSPAASDLLAPSAADEATLFRRFEAEILGAVAQPTAEALFRILAAPRAAVLSERTPERRAEILAKLDLVEDVLDAVLLASPAQSEDTEMGREPP